MITTLEKENLAFPTLCQTNISLFWGGIIAETLARLGVQTAITVSGNRAVPLITACALNKKLKTIPILDERSAAFFALGLAKQTYRPVALVCTSGTAAANFYPAIIEARMTKVPLIVLTTDRPPELRGCHSGQTIDQVKIYGDYPLFYKELAIPEANFDLFYYLRQTLTHAYERSLSPQAGPVHLNIPFRDPLSPVIDDSFVNFLSEFDLNDFFNTILPRKRLPAVNPCYQISQPIPRLQEIERGLIVVGTIQPEDPQEFTNAIGTLAKILRWPVLAEGLSPLRNFSDTVPVLISRYDSILRNSDIADSLKPEQLIQIGDFPTSKILRSWLKSAKPQTWVLENSAENIDPLHGNTISFRINLQDFVHTLNENKLFAPPTNNIITHYSNSWKTLEEQADKIISTKLSACLDLFEGKIAWLLSTILPEQTPFFAATSMPVRDVEFFWKKTNRKIQPFFNRGANGIDGIVSTALGVAHENKPTVLLVGDLTFLHDSNGLLIKNYFKGSLTIVLINNDGGRIFENLPVSQFEEIFEKYIATPQHADYAKLAQYHGLPYYRPNSWDDFISLVSNLPSSGIRIIEMLTDSKFDIAFRKNLFKDITEKIIL